MEIDIERLRNDLINYFGSAISYFNNAIIDLIEVENSSPNILIEIAINNNFDLNNYIINSKQINLKK